MRCVIEVIARALIKSGNSLLLCRSVRGGYFYLPGGHVEAGESAESATARELLEEAGVIVKPISLALVSEEAFTQSGKSRHELNLMFHVEHNLDSVVPVPSLESGIDFEWVPASRLAAIDLRPASVRQWLARHSVNWPSGTDWLPMA